MEIAEAHDSGGTLQQQRELRRRRNSEKPYTMQRKSVQERNSRSSRRKSGPKSYDVENVRAEGRESRRRLSKDLRRTSKGNRVAALRRLSVGRPPLSALPRMTKLGGATTPRVSSAVTTAVNGTSTIVVVGGIGFGKVGQLQAARENVGNGEVQQAGLEEVEDPTWTVEMVAEAARGIMSGDHLSQLRYARWLRMVLSLSETPPAAELVRAGLVRELVEFLRARDFPEVLPEALCALTNIASTCYTKSVSDEPGAVPTVIALMRHSDPYIREQSAWCLGNIAGDCVELRNLVLDAGGMEGLLLNLANPCSPTVVRTGTWALANFCRGLPAPPLATVVPVLPVLRRTISSPTADPGALIESGWVLYHITRAGGDRIDAMLVAGLLTRLPDLLLHDNVEVVKPVIRTMDNMACSSGAHRGALIAAGVLDPLLEVLGHDSTKVRADALRLLSCIAAGSSDQVAAVAATADMIPSVMTELEEGNASCRREAAWVFLNMCQCGFEAHESLIPSLVGQGLIAAVCNNLDAQEEAESLVVMLALLYSILEDGGRGGDGSRLEEYRVLVEESDGFGRTLKLVNEHEDMEVYDKGLDIVRTFVDGGYDDDDDDEEEHDDHREDDGSLMSDDSLLSDDSFHPELGDDTTMPMAPPSNFTAANDPTSSPLAIPPPSMRSNIPTAMMGVVDAASGEVPNGYDHKNPMTIIENGGTRQCTTSGAPVVSNRGDGDLASAFGGFPVARDESPALDPKDLGQTE